MCRSMCDTVPTRTEIHPVLARCHFLLVHRQPQPHHIRHTTQPINERREAILHHNRTTRKFSHSHRSKE